MPLLETEAIVLRSYRLGEADKIASLLTRQSGRLRAVATAAQRPKSRFGATLEPLTYIRLWLFERDNRDLLRINSAEILEPFFDMQRTYRVHIAAQYVAEAAEKVLPERETNERVFRLVLAVLRSMKRTSEVDRPLVFFNYWLLRLAGVLPDFEKCATCGRLLEGGSTFFEQNRGAVVCTHCRRSGSGRLVSDDALAFARRAQQSSLDAWLDAEPCRSEAAEARRFLEALLEAHAEMKFVTRELLDEAGRLDIK